MTPLKARTRNPENKKVTDFVRQALFAHVDESTIQTISQLLCALDIRTSASDYWELQQAIDVLLHHLDAGILNSPPATRSQIVYGLIELRDDENTAHKRLLCKDNPILHLHTIAIAVIKQSSVVANKISADPSLGVAAENYLLLRQVIVARLPDVHNWITEYATDGNRYAYCSTAWNAMRNLLLCPYNKTSKASIIRRNAETIAHSALVHAAVTHLAKIDSQPAKTSKIGLSTYWPEELTCITTESTFDDYVLAVYAPNHTASDPEPTALIQVRSLVRMMRAIPPRLNSLNSYKVPQGEKARKLLHDARQSNCEVRQSKAAQKLETTSLADHTDRTTDELIVRPCKRKQKAHSNYDKRVARNFQQCLGSNALSPSLLCKIESIIAREKPDVKLAWIMSQVTGRPISLLAHLRLQSAPHHHAPLLLYPDQDSTWRLRWPTPSNSITGCMPLAPYAEPPIALPPIISDWLHKCIADHYTRPFKAEGRNAIRRLCNIIKRHTTGHRPENILMRTAWTRYLQHDLSDQLYPATDDMCTLASIPATYTWVSQRDLYRAMLLQSQLVSGLPITSLPDHDGDPQIGYGSNKCLKLSAMALPKTAANLLDLYRAAAGKAHDKRRLTNDITKFNFWARINSDLAICYRARVTPCSHLEIDGINYLYVNEKSRRNGWERLAQISMGTCPLDGQTAISYEICKTLIRRLTGLKKEEGKRLNHTRHAARSSLTNLPMGRMARNYRAGHQTQGRSPYDRYSLETPASLGRSHQP